MAIPIGVSKTEVLELKIKCYLHQGIIVKFINFCVRMFKKRRKNQLVSSEYWCLVDHLSTLGGSELVDRAVQLWVEKERFCLN